MSLNIEPDYQAIIARLVLILRASVLLFPRSVGGDNTKTDLVNQIIENQLPIPNLSIEGPDAPYIFVASSETPLITEEQRGRDDRNTQGSKRVTLEFYLVILSESIGRIEAEQQLYPIISALTTELNKNKRLTDPATGLLPLSITHSYQVVPYIYDITQNETVAKNVVLRPVLGVNLR